MTWSMMESVEGISGALPFWLSSRAAANEGPVHIGA